jgi:hypothetical protein
MCAPASTPQVRFRGGRGRTRPPARTPPVVQPATAAWPLRTYCTAGSYTLSVSQKLYFSNPCCSLLVH